MDKDFKSGGYERDSSQNIKDIQLILEERYSGVTPEERLRTVIREIVQNADDAGATCLDLDIYCEPDSQCSLMKTPGLLIYNDGLVKKNDIKAMFLASFGNKENDIEKVGRFGLGMKSIFHLCETFIFYSCLSDNGVKYGLLNPWIGSDKKRPELDPVYPDWEKEVEEYGKEILEKQYKDCQVVPGQNKGLLLWLPLRIAEHLKRSKVPETPCGIQSKRESWYGEDIKALRETIHAMVDSLALNLAQTKNLQKIALPHYANDQLSRPSLEKSGSSNGFHGLSIDSFEGPRLGELFIQASGLINKKWNIKYLEIAKNEKLESIRTSDEWPKNDKWENGLNNPDQPVKAIEHAAITIMLRTLDNGVKSTTALRWAVFFPLDDRQSEEDINNEKIELLDNQSGVQMDIILHGYFLPTSDRQKIPGITDYDNRQNFAHYDVFRRWNISLSQNMILPNIPMALFRALNDSTQDQDGKRKLVQSVRNSKLVRDNCDDITKKHYLIAAKIYDEQEKCVKDELRCLEAQLAKVCVLQCFNNLPKIVQTAIVKKWSSDSILIDAECPGLLPEAVLETGWNMDQVNVVLDAINLDVLLDQTICQGEYTWLDTLISEIKNIQKKLNGLTQNEDKVEAWLKKTLYTKEVLKEGKRPEVYEFLINIIQQNYQNQWISVDLEQIKAIREIFKESYNKKTLYILPIKQGANHQNRNVIDLDLVENTILHIEQYIEDEFKENMKNYRKSAWSACDELIKYYLSKNFKQSNNYKDIKLYEMIIVKDLFTDIEKPCSLSQIENNSGMFFYKESNDEKTKKILNNLKEPIKNVIPGLNIKIVPKHYKNEELKELKMDNIVRLMFIDDQRMKMQDGFEEDKCKIVKTILEESKPDSTTILGIKRLVIGISFDRNTSYYYIKEEIPEKYRNIFIKHQKSKQCIHISDVYINELSKNLLESIDIELIDNNNFYDKVKQISKQNSGSMDSDDKKNMLEILYRFVPPMDDAAFAKRYWMSLPYHKHGCGIWGQFSEDDVWIKDSIADLQPTGTMVIVDQDLIDAYRWAVPDKQYQDDELNRIKQKLKDPEPVKYHSEFEKFVQNKLQSYSDDDELKKLLRSKKWIMNNQNGIAFENIVYIQDSEYEKHLSNAIESTGNIVFYNKLSQHAKIIVDLLGPKLNIVLNDNVLDGTCIGNITYKKLLPSGFDVDDQRMKEFYQRLETSEYKKSDAMNLLAFLKNKGKEYEDVKKFVNRMRGVDIQEMVEVFNEIVSTKPNRDENRYFLGIQYFKILVQHLDPDAGIIENIKILPNNNMHVSWKNPNDLYLHDIIADEDLLSSDYREIYRDQIDDNINDEYWSTSDTIDENQMGVFGTRMQDLKSKIKKIGGDCIIELYSLNESNPLIGDYGKNTAEIPFDIQLNYLILYQKETKSDFYKDSTIHKFGLIKPDYFESIKEDDSIIKKSFKHIYEKIFKNNSEPFEDWWNAGPTPIELDDVKDRITQDQVVEIIKKFKPFQIAIMLREILPSQQAKTDFLQTFEARSNDVDNSGYSNNGMQRNLSVDQNAIHKKRINYNQDTYPSDMIDPKSQEIIFKKDKIEHWMVLFILGACRSMGLPSNKQHKGFIEWMKEVRWWNEIVNAENHIVNVNLIMDKWVYSKETSEDLKYFQWTELVPLMYWVRKYINGYMQVFLNLNHEAYPIRNIQDIENLFAPKSNPVLSGSGNATDVPLIPLRIGKVWILRELVRLNIVEIHEKNEILLDYCWYPSETVLGKVGISRNNNYSHFLYAKEFTNRLKQYNPETFKILKETKMFDIPLGSEI